LPAGDAFPADAVARARRYHRPRYVAQLVDVALGLGALALLAVTPVGDALYPDSWPWWAAVLVFPAVVVAVSELVRAPLSFWRGYVHEHRWGFSRQSVRDWLLDRVKGFGVSVVLTTAAIAGLVALTHAFPGWWVAPAAVGAAALVALLVFVTPVVLEPIFNRFEPLSDQELADALRALAQRASVPVRDVLVADASRRTTAENAYVAGFGATKRLVLYDTLVKAGDERETLFIVGHELGHRAEGHIWKSLVVSSVGLFVGFGALAWLVTRGPLLTWAGASSLADMRVIPALLLFATVAGIVVLPAETAVSRRFEAQADQIGVELTGDPDAAVGAFRRLGLDNLADLQPPEAAVWLLFTHPPIPDRIRSVMRAGAETPG
jgi:STE24 endopeptidase